MYRQGDVFLMKAQIPKDAKPIQDENGLLILARGEATGHHHSVSARNAIMLMVGTVMYLRCLRKTELKHQEHGPIVLPKGDYIVKRQREYHPEEIRNVQD